jgi:hypothetical protein
MDVMSYLEKYRKSDFKKLRWEEYGKILEELFKKVSKYIKEKNIEIDVVVPILRGGAFPGTFLAFKFHLLRILPVQYKYFFEGRELVLKKLFGLSKFDFKEKENPVFLLVENNHCFGLTAETAAKDLKAEFPNCRIIYAADLMDYSYQKNKYAEAIFFGKLNNETKKLSDEECKRLGIDNKSRLFPWEDIEEEWTTVQGEQFKYADVEEVSASAESKAKINLDEL